MSEQPHKCNQCDGTGIVTVTGLSAALLCTSCEAGPRIRLNIAAPDLLKAAKAAVSTWDNIVPGEIIKIPAQAILDMLRNAVSKAEGGE